jgi:hypothetical protein
MILFLIFTDSPEPIVEYANLIGSEYDDIGDIIISLLKMFILPLNVPERSAVPIATSWVCIILLKIFRLPFNNKIIAYGYILIAGTDIQGTL